MQKIITVRTDKRNGLYDITSEVVSMIKESKVKNGIASVYARGSTAAIMIQENWDQSVQNDVVTLLNRWYLQEYGNMTARIITGMHI